VEEAAELIQPVRDELIRQAAQGEVVHNDDTSMKVLKLEREPGDQRTGVFTSGIVSTGQGQKIALYFTGRQHAGENIADVLKQRAAERPAPIQMCDALSRNAPKLPPGVEILLGELPCAWKKTVRGSGGELSRRMPLCAGDAGPCIWPRCRSARGKP